MTYDFFPDLTEALAAHGFREVENISNMKTPVDLLLKRQTWNTNRAVVVVTLQKIPSDFQSYVRELRAQVAHRCRFVPFFWGIGIQAIVVMPGIGKIGLVPGSYIDLVDNQWAIVQSLFLVDPSARVFMSGRTWGQFVTGKFQDAIAVALGRHFQSQGLPPQPPASGIGVSVTDNRRKGNGDA